MTMNPFEQSKQQLLHSLTSQVEQEVIDYIRQEMQHDAPDSVPIEEELLTFFQSPDEPTKLDAYHPETGKRIIKNVLGKTQAECKAKLTKAIEDCKLLDTPTRTSTTRVSSHAAA